MTETTNYVRPAIQNVSDDELLECKKHAESLLMYYKYWGNEDHFQYETKKLGEKLAVLQNELLDMHSRHRRAEQRVKEEQKCLWNLEIEQARRSDEKAKASVRRTSDAKKTKTREERIDEKYALLPEAFKNSMPLADARKFIEDNML